MARRHDIEKTGSRRDNQPKKRGQGVRRGGESPPGNLTTNRMKEHPAVEASQRNNKQKIGGAQQGGGCWTAWQLESGRRELGGLMA
jgi:hypothetical protein